MCLLQMNADGWPSGSIPWKLLVPGKWYRHLSRHPFEPGFRHLFSKFEGPYPPNPEFVQTKDYVPSTPVTYGHLPAFPESFTSVMVHKSNSRFYDIGHQFPEGVTPVRADGMSPHIRDEIVNQTWESRKHAISAWHAHWNPENSAGAGSAMELNQGGGTRRSRRLRKTRRLRRLRKQVRA